MSGASLKKNADGSERIMLGAVIMAEKPARRKRRRHDSTFSVEILRLREIEALIRQRHRGPVPDPEDTDDRELCLGYIRAAALALTGQDMAAWCRVWAPWATDADILPIVKEAVRRRRMMRADGVAGLLCVTMAERTALGFRTIGACDMTKAERNRVAKEKKRERDRKRDERKRRAAGAKDRESYVASSLSRSKPWEALNMSRAQWYRKGKPSHETSPSRVEVIGKGEEPVSRVIGKGEEPHPQPVPGNVAVREACGERGSGSETPTGFQGAAPHGRRFIRMSPPEHLRKDAA